MAAATPEIHSASHHWYSLKPADLGHLLPARADGTRINVIDPNSLETEASARCWEIAKIALEIIAFVAISAGIVTVAAIFLGTTIYIAPITITLFIIAGIFFNKVLSSQIQESKEHCRATTLLTQVQAKLAAEDGVLNAVNNNELLNAQLGTRIRANQADAAQERWAAIGEEGRYALFKERAVTYDILHEELVAVERKFNIALVELEMLRAVENPSGFILAQIQQKEVEVQQLGFVQYPRLKLHVAFAQARLERPEFNGSFIDLGQLQTPAVWTPRALSASLPSQAGTLIPYCPAAVVGGQSFSERHLGPAINPVAEGINLRGQQFNQAAIETAIGRVNDNEAYQAYGAERTTNALLTGRMVHAMPAPAAED